MQSGSAMPQDELDELYAIAADEMASGQLQNGLWHRMVAEADGDEKVARARYLRERVKQLQINACAVSLPSLQPNSKNMDHNFNFNFSKLPFFIEPIHAEIGPFSEGLAPFVPYSSSAVYPKLYGYLDSDGGIKIKPKFTKAEAFRNGLALVEVNAQKEGESLNFDDLRRWGVINSSGMYVVVPQFHMVIISGNNYYFGKKLANDEIDEFEYNTKTGSLVNIKKSGGATMLFFGPASLAPREFKKISSRGFWDRAKVGKFGYVDKTNNFKIPPKFQHARCFHSGRAFVSEAGGARFYIIDEAGSRIGTDYFDEVSQDFFLSFSHDVGRDVEFASIISKVSDREFWWHVDRNGRTLNSKNLDCVSPVDELSYYTFARDQKFQDWSFADSSGVEASEIEIERMCGLPKGWTIFNENEKFGVSIDGKGVVIPPIFTSISYIGEGKIALKIGSATSQGSGMAERQQQKSGGDLGRCGVVKIEDLKKMLSKD